MPKSNDRTHRLRGNPPPRPMHVVLVEPEIPPNTGNIARLCAATASRLHLVGPLGFSVDDKAVRRAGLDYWHLVEVSVHVDFAHFLNAFRKDSPEGRLHLYSGMATTSYLDRPTAFGDALVFGKESVGLSEELLDAYPEDHVAIPTLGAVRSLNLANAVGIALFESLRRADAFATTFMG